MQPPVRQAIAEGSRRELAGGMMHRGFGDPLTMLASGAALVVSCVSLWETALKQPDLQVYLGSNLGLTRDPWGSDEVLVVPVSITNSGARDGAVLSLELNVRTKATGASDRFESSYVADASYFGSTDDVTVNRHRPKTPFAPIVISGRTTFSGTLLFYPHTSHPRNPFIEGKSNLELTLTLNSAKPSGWLDRALASAPEPITVPVSVPDFFPGALLSGEIAKLQQPDVSAPR
jgi:hypothetical protein